MAGKHTQLDSFDTVVSYYVTSRARELIAQAETGIIDDLNDVNGSIRAMATWIGAATEILRELTRNA